MRLLIISNTAHYWSNGRIVGWGPTVLEIDHLSQLFDHVRHIACLHEGPAAESSVPYASDRVTLVPVRAAGGPGLRCKVSILREASNYLRVIAKELRQTDAVHVRCPANISLLAIIYLALSRRPEIRWVKYAGTWHPNGNRSLASSFQRWWLNRGFAGGVVTVNGSWPNQPLHVHSFLNPCLTDHELEGARELGTGKEMTRPIKLLFAGQLSSNKGPQRALRILALLQRSGIPARLDLVGDGPERAPCNALAAELNIAHVTRFHGWVPRPSMTAFYRESHILLLPSQSEGWPKVVSEAMAHGAVPVAGEVGSIHQTLTTLGVGRAVCPTDLDGFCASIHHYFVHPNVWKVESAKACEAAAEFTYSRYLEAVRALLGLANARAHEIPLRSSDRVPPSGS